MAWNNGGWGDGAVVDPQHGGTGLTTYITGDTLFASSANTLAKLPIGTAGQVLTVTGGVPDWETPSAGSGTVTTVSVTTANGVSGSVATPTTTPAITLTLGAITPSSVAVSGNVNINGATNVSSFGVNSSGRNIGVTAASAFFFGLGAPNDLAAGNTEFLNIQQDTTDALITVTKTGTGSYRPLSIRNNGSTQMQFPAAGGVTIANTTTLSALTASTALALDGSKNIVSVTNTGTGDNVLNTSPTFATGVTLSSAPLTLSGNISSAAWTTNGLRIKGVAATFTDTTSSGTVSEACTDVFGGNTIAASSSTTFTDYETFKIKDPVAGSNVTMTNKWSLATDSIKVGTSNALKVSTAGVATFAAQPIFSSVTASTAAAFDSSKGLVSVTNTGTGNNVLSASPTFTGTITAVNATYSGMTQWKKGTNITQAATITVAGDGNMYKFANGTTTINYLTFTGIQSGTMLLLLGPSSGTATIKHTAASPGAAACAFRNNSAVDKALGVNDQLLIWLDNDANDNTGLWRAIASPV